jgi:hypothetical protein
VVDWLGAVAYPGPGDCRCRLPAVTAFLRTAPCRFFAPAYRDDRPCCWKSCDAVAAGVVVAVLAAADGSGAADGHGGGGEEQQRGPGWDRTGTGNSYEPEKDLKL